MQKSPSRPLPYLLLRNRESMSFVSRSPVVLHVEVLDPVLVKHPLYSGRRPRGESDGWKPQLKTNSKTHNGCFLRGERSRCVIVTSLDQYDLRLHEEPIVSVCTCIPREVYFEPRGCSSAVYQT